jgi:Ca2+-binding RTX toxin-like protein
VPVSTLLVAASVVLLAGRVERLRVGLVGGRGNDSLNGGGGKDKLYAGKGKDSLVADDRRRDLVDGGGGVDSFQYDHGLDVVRNKP